MFYMVLGYMFRHNIETVFDKYNIPKTRIAALLVYLILVFVPFFGKMKIWIIIKTMPGAPVIMVVVLLTMIAFYATSFDSIALTASCYSYHTLEDGEQPNKGIQLMWCILLILLPIALLFAESSMNNLQSVSIVAAFPIGAVIVMIAVSFMKDAKKYMEELGNKK